MSKTEKPSHFVLMPMPEWRDGQPGCMGCYQKRDGSWTELKIGQKVYFNEETSLYYCRACGEKGVGA